MKELLFFFIDADAEYIRAMRLMSGFFASLPNFLVHQHQQAFTVKLKSHWSWFFKANNSYFFFKMRHI